MKTLTQVQDKLIATVVKCYRSSIAKGRRMGSKQPAIRVAENKAQRELESMGFTMIQADTAVREALDMAKLLVECEA
jgi:hypothetical protein